MILQSLSELLLYPVSDRGIPNSERIPILVQEHTDMGKFGVMLGLANRKSFANPYQDNLFWFGDGIVKPGDWIFLYTGNGTPRADDWHTPQGSKIYSVHWGKSKTIFANSSIVPILFRADAVQVGSSVVDLPQLG